MDLWPQRPTSCPPTLHRGCLTWRARRPEAPYARHTAGALPTWRPWHSEPWQARANPGGGRRDLRLGFPPVPAVCPSLHSPWSTSSTRAFSAARFASSSSRSLSSCRNIESSSSRRAETSMAQPLSGRGGAKPPPSKPRSHRPLG